MSPAQGKAAMALVSSALSPAGFEKVQQIMEGDEVNKAGGQNNPNRGPGPGGPQPRQRSSAKTSITFRFSARRRKPTVDAAVRGHHLA